MILKIIAWALWFFFLILAISNLPVFDQGLAANTIIGNTDLSASFPIFAIIISIVAIIEASVTIALRKFLLLRPAQRGTLSIVSFSGSVRFFIVSVVNWFLVNSIIVYGLILFDLSNRVVFFYIFFFFGILLLIYHAPRLSPFGARKE